MKIDLEEYSVISKIPKIKGKFINRELSWLSFNNRVLYCANNKALPLNERLKFLAISCSNLDEFISVRYAGALTSKKEPVKKILKGIKDCMKNQFITYSILKDELKKENIFISKMSDLSKKEIVKVCNIFMNHIFPMLTPISIGSTNEIPNFYSGQNCICATVKHGNMENLIIIPINKNLENMYMIDNKVLMVEDIILYFLGKLFINKEISSSGYFRVIKDASVILNHDTSKYLLDRMINTIEKREMANPIFLQISNDTPKRLKRILENVFNINSDNIFSDATILDYNRFMSHKLLSDKYSYKPFEPCVYEVAEERYSIFSCIKEKDILLHHPYDSYDTVVKFIEHAAIDPDVLAIKQTLYRVSSEDSPIVNALCKAARMGKFVSVLIEIKARFDESRNINLINKLKKSGVNVLLGLEYLKTHCKMCIVVRREKDKMVMYSHIGTGNYNEKTARLYTDLSYLTSKQKVGMDLLHVFNILSGISTPDENLQRVFYAPVNLRKRLIKNIDREISNAKKGKSAEIFLKLNSINDPEMINKLYEAADKGVKVYIISRGITSIVPRDNIYIKSIVGRFLEHSRIYYFKNGDKPEYYISSADMLTRNLNKRVEILFHVKDEHCKAKLDNIIKVFKEDRVNSFKMNEDGQYKHLKGEFDCHQWFIDNAENTVKIKIAKRNKK